MTDETFTECTVCRFIPHGRAEEFRRDGWTVKPMIGYSGHWSMLATKTEPAPCPRGMERGGIPQPSPHSAAPFQSGAPSLLQLLTLWWEIAIGILAAMAWINTRRR